MGRKNHAQFLPKINSDIKSRTLKVAFVFITDDDTRVELRPIPGVQGSDYINANYIHVSFNNIFLFSLQSWYKIFGSMKPFFRKKSHNAVPIYSALYSEAKFVCYRLVTCQSFMDRLQTSLPILSEFKGIN